MTKANPDAAQCAVRLRRSVLVLARRLRPSMQGDGISAAKLSVIGRLYRGGPMSPTELAAREGVKLPSLTRLVAELEGDGWLAREAHASDGRRSLLRLTPFGRKRLVAAAQAADAPLANAIATAISADERRVLLQACALLEKIGDAMTNRAEKRIAHPTSITRP
jgi:DNA-binding MarR family transcriptional regulator